MTIEHHLRARIRAGLEAIPEADRAGTYAVSVLLYFEEDDPRRPVVHVGHNTEARVAACTPAPGQAPRWPIASSAAEARWSYAFWLQDVLAAACDEGADPEGARLRDAWARAHGYWYSDEEEAANLDAALRRVSPLAGAFLGLLTSAVRDLHLAGEVARLVGHPVPVLVHELEYVDETAELAEAANPGGLAEEFARYVRSL